MGQVIKFPPTENKIAAEQSSTIALIMNALFEDTIRHLTKYNPDLLEEHGSDLVQVWSAFVLEMLSNKAFESVTETLGEEKRSSLYIALTKDIRAS